MLPKSFIRVLLLVLFSYFTNNGNIIAQQVQMDSLCRLISPNNPDSINGNIYYELAKQYYSNDTKKALIWAEQGASHFKNIESYQMMTRCMNLKAVCLFILEKYDESIKLHYDILKIREQLKDDDAIAETLLNLGNHFYQGKDREQALYYYLKSKQLALNKDNIRLLSSLYNNIANIYKDDYYARKNNSDKIMAIKYSKLALAYKEKLKTDKTLENSYLTLAHLYFDSKEFNTAYNYAKKGEKLAIINKNDESVANSKIILAEIALENKNTNEAKIKLDELYAYVAKTEASHILNANDEAIKLVHKRIKNINYNTIAEDSSINEMEKEFLLSRQQIREELKIKYETERKELDNANLKLKNEIEQNKAQKIKIINIISSLFAIILLILIVKLIKKNKSIVKSEAAIQIQAQQLHDQNTLLKQSDALKAKIFSVISHDLKSPLSTLKSIVELSADTKLSADQITYIMSEIKLELDVTSNLLNDLLFWSKNQIKNNEIALKWFNLNIVVHKCINTFQNSIKLKNLQVNNLIPNNLFIYGDEVRCEFIIRNIIHNAIKYSELYKKIDIGFLLKNQVGNIYIKDNGIGISEEKIQKLFCHDKVRQSTKGTMDEQGAGIGLLLSKDFAESLGWTIQTKSKLGIGTTFSILIKQKEFEYRDILDTINSSNTYIEKPLISDI